jgi:hypothetical protein
MWKAPEAMNRMWSVLTGPCLVGDGRALDEGQEVALHALAAHVGAARLGPGADLVDLVEEDDAVLLHGLERGARDRLVVEELVGLLVQETS